MNKSIFKPAIIALAFASAFTGSGNLYAAQGESVLTETMKGWAPYLPRAGTIVRGREDGQTPQVKTGDIIEVPTYLLNSRWYEYQDGNATQDGDEDNTSRVRPGQFTVPIDGTPVAQKVSVHWYIVTPKDKAVRDWAPPETPKEDFNDETLNQSWITQWEHVNATPVGVEAYTMPLEGSKSLALKIPGAAAGKRIGFIIVPESQTGDPFRGQPMKVPDLNYIWEQPEPQGPGDLCIDKKTKFDGLKDVSDSNVISELVSCVIDPTNPAIPNPKEKPIEDNFGNGGGDVGKADYIVTIHYLKDPDAEPNPITDPILGTTNHPRPLVNSTYYADIQVLKKNSDPEVVEYRDLDPDLTATGASKTEVNSISWNFYRGDIDLEELSRASDIIARNTILTAALITKADQDGATGRTGSKVGRDGRTYFTFKTQTTNDEANTVFANAFLTNWAWTPNELLNPDTNGESSEQRTRLRVTFDYDENQQ